MVNSLESFGEELVISMYWYGGAGMLFNSLDNGNNWNYIGQPVDVYPTESYCNEVGLSEDNVTWYEELGILGGYDPNQGDGVPDQGPQDPRRAPADGRERVVQSRRGAELGV